MYPFIGGCRGGVGTCARRRGIGRYRGDDSIRPRTRLGRHGVYIGSGARAQRWRGQLEEVSILRCCGVLPGNLLFASSQVKLSLHDVQDPLFLEDKLGT